MNKELKQILLSAEKTTVSAANSFLVNQLKQLQRNGDLELGADKDLKDLSLELRVQQLFKSIGLNIKEGRPSQEDFLVIADSKNNDHKDNIVIEVKSSSHPTPQLKDLRQLDDWVFDLSGEEKARKHGLGGNGDMTARFTNGWASSIQKHPSPHKGLFVFNGPAGMPFSERASRLLHPNQQVFVEKRNFCVISINNLVELFKQGKNGAWSALHNTVGEYQE